MVTRSEEWTAVAAAMAAMASSADEQVTSVAALLDHGWWKRFVQPNGSVVVHDTFAGFVKAEPLEGLGIRDPRAWARSLSTHSHLRLDANRIVRAIGEEIPELGAPRVNTGGDRNTISDDGNYVIARLKRDDPELAIEVIHGNISAHAAAIKAGIRRPRSTFVTDSIDGAMAALLRHFSYEDILAALKRVQP